MNKFKKITPGFHGDHFGALFGFGYNLDKFTEEFHLSERNKSIKNIIKNKTDEYVIKNLYLSDKIIVKKIFKRRNNLWDKLFGERSYKENLLVLFPYFKTNIDCSIKNRQIMERKGFKMEAQIKGQCINELGNGVGFYAIDYARNKEKYKKDGKLHINLGGFCYTVNDFEYNGKFSLDFTGYMPYNNKVDEYQFVGYIIDILESIIDNKEIYILKTKIAGYEKAKDSFILELFLNKKNLRTKLKIGKKISGVFWMFGYIKNKKKNLHYNN